MADQEIICSENGSCGDENVEVDKRIRNKDIRNKVVVASTVYKMRNPILRWFGHVKRNSVDASVRRWKVGNGGHQER